MSLLCLVYSLDGGRQAKAEPLSNVMGSRDRVIRTRRLFHCVYSALPI